MRGRAAFYRWKKPAHVSRLAFTLDEHRKPIRVGGGYTGDYFLGRLRFNDGKKHRVVIKRFKPDYTANRLAAAHFSRALKRLVQEGVRVPKMGMMKIPTPGNPEGEYVVVAPFFGSRAKGSAFEKNHVSRQSPLPIRAQAIEQLARIANAGLLTPLDAVNVHTNHSRGVRVIDLDFVIEHILFHNQKTPLPLTPNDSAKELRMSVRELGNNPAEKKQLWDIALRFASPMIKKEMGKLGLDD